MSASKLSDRKLTENGITLAAGENRVRYFPAVVCPVSLTADGGPPVDGVPGGQALLVAAQVGLDGDLGRVLDGAGDLQRRARSADASC